MAKDQASAQTLHKKAAFDLTALRCEHCQAVVEEMVS